MAVSKLVYMPPISFVDWWVDVLELVNMPPIVTVDRWVIHDYYDCRSHAGIKHLLKIRCMVVFIVIHYIRVRVLKCHVKENAFKKHLRKEHDDLAVVLG